MDAAGSVTASVDLDPWGWQTGRSWNASAQPRRYTTYERDGNDSDEAMHRRYNRWHLRFDQPDPTDGSYDLTDPQSFNRYSYAKNDPVNFTDPLGLMPNLFPLTWGANFGIGGFGGWGGGWDLNDRPMWGRGIIKEGEILSEPFYRWAYYWWNDIGYEQEMPYASMFAAGPWVDPGTLGPPPGIPPDCYRGRIQAQGEHPKVEKSVNWANGLEDAPRQVRRPAHAQ